jgi:hypothetical protein
LVEHFLGKEEVTGSIPVNGSSLRPAFPLPEILKIRLLLARRQFETETDD